MFLPGDVKSVFLVKKNDVKDIPDYMSGHSSFLPFNIHNNGPLYIAVYVPWWFEIRFYRKGPIKLQYPLLLQPL